MVAQKYMPLVARVLVAVIFIHSGVGKILNFGGTQQAIASKGLPLAALVAIFAIVFELMGGASLILGYKARVGAILLLVFLIPTTVLFHNPIADATQITQFLKNLAIIGGILMIFTYGSGPVSLDGQGSSGGS